MLHFKINSFKTITEPLSSVITETVQEAVPYISTIIGANMGAGECCGKMFQDLYNFFRIFGNQ